MGSKTLLFNYCICFTTAVFTLCKAVHIKTKAEHIFVACITKACAVVCYVPYTDLIKRECLAVHARLH